MKIAMLTTSFLPIPASKGGAVEILMTELLEQIKKNDNLNIDVFNNCPNKDNVKEKQDYINYFFLPNSKKEMLFDYVRRANKFFRKKILKKNLYIKTSFVSKLIKKHNLNKYDMLLVEGSPHQILQLREAYKGKIVLHIHTTMQFTKEVPFAKEILTACDYVLANSEFVKMRITEIDPNQKEKVILFLNCIKTKNFGKEEFKEFRESYRKELNITKREKLLLYSGRIVPEKGIKELLLALKNCPKSKLVVMGGNFLNNQKNQAYLQELKEISNELENRIYFTGFVKHSEIAKYIYACDIGVVPSLCEEAAGLVAIEALASGLPVIATNMGGLPEYVSKNAGIIVENDENLVQNLSSAINILSNDEELYLEKKKNAKLSIEKFDMKEYYKNFKKILKTIVK